MSSGKKVAIIDMGSNTIKVLVADMNPVTGRLQPLYNSTKEARISTGIGTGEKMILRPESMQRGLQAVQELLAEAAVYLPQEIQIVATSAVRDAENREEYKKLIFDHTGHQLNVLSGQEEAQGIAEGILCDPAVDHLRNFYISDMGGGSLEVIDVLERQAQQFESFPLGAVRVSEKLLADPRAPMKEEDVLRIREHTKSVFVNSSFDTSRKHPVLVGAGGSFTIGRAIFAYRAGCTFEEFGSQISLPAFIELMKELSALSYEERVATGIIPPNRADIFPAALVTLCEMCEMLGIQEIFHSNYTLRYGLARRLFSGL